jgi:NodT family efflux transporter outer membrane factor (OMF) lipoprotein
MVFESRLPAGPRGLTAVAGLAALLTGCAVGPDFHHPDAKPPEGYTSEKLNLAAAAGVEAKQNLAVGKKISGQWWELFHAQRLDAVFNEALADNQNLAAARASLAQAQTSISAAAGAFWPHVQMATGVSRQQANGASSGFDGLHSDFSLYSIGPNVSYTLDAFGLTRRQVEQQQALAEFREYQLDAAYLTLCGDIVNQAITIASTRQQIDIYREIIADDERNLNNVSEQLALGEATRTDMEQARTQLNTDRAQLPPLQQQLSAAKHAMATLVGKSPSEWVAPDFDLSEFTLPDELPVTIPSELLRQRPDILSAEAQLHAASAAIGVATAQMYPQVNLTATLAQQAIDPANLFTGAGTIWSIAAQLTAPIFQGGTLEAQREGAVAAFQSQAATYQQTVLTSFQQVADTLTALQNDAESLDRWRSATESADAERGLIRETYRSGGVTILQVLDAERSFAVASLSYTRSNAQRYIDSAQLFNAMGGGWWDWRAKDNEMAAKSVPATMKP